MYIKSTSTVKLYQLPVPPSCVRANDGYICPSSASLRKKYRDILYIIYIYIICVFPHEQVHNTIRISCTVGTGYESCLINNGNDSI